MDGDVLYDRRMLARLLGASGEAVLLVDRAIEPGVSRLRSVFPGRRLSIFANRQSTLMTGMAIRRVLSFFRAVAAALAKRCEERVALGADSTEYEEQSGI